MFGGTISSALALLCLLSAASRSRTVDVIDGHPDRHQGRTRIQLNPAPEPPELLELLEHRSPRTPRRPGLRPATGRSGGTAGFAPTLAAESPTGLMLEQADTEKFAIDRSEVSKRLLVQPGHDRGELVRGFA